MSRTKGRICCMTTSNQIKNVVYICYSSNGNNLLNQKPFQTYLSSFFPFSVENMIEQHRNTYTLSKLQIVFTMNILYVAYVSAFQFYWIVLLGLSK